MGIQNMTPERLREYVRTHHEDAYVLLDVRQPREYQMGHIPGARLMPLPDLVRAMEQLPVEKELILYCHGGGRSMTAAAMLEEEGFHGPLYNLAGGMSRWDGARVEDYPKVGLFTGQSLAGMFETAMNLEKGAQIFYETVGRDYASHDWAKVFERLSKAEIAHARTVHGYWRQIDAGIDAFEPVYERFSGEVLEGGMALEDALQKVAGMKKDACLRLIEMALQIEYAAFDLYRTLADQADTHEGRQAFIQLSQAEKAHMHALIGAIEACANP